MMTLILPETGSQIKPHTSDRLGNLGTGVETDSPSDRVAIIIQISMRGSCTLRILADHSDEYDRLNERLAAARPVLEMLQAVVMAER